jgi:hypothetical protein
MNETMLNDLQQKIRNLVHDFGLEHDIPGLVDVSVEANRIIVDVKERAVVVPASLRVRDVLPNESIYLSDPLTGETRIDRIIDASTGQDVDADTFAKSLREFHAQETGRVNTADNLPTLDESDHTSDTSRMTAPSDPLTIPLDVGVKYPDAPGMVFNSHAEYENWLSQQKRTRR